MKYKLEKPVEGSIKKNTNVPLNGAMANLLQMSLPLLAEKIQVLIHIRFCFLHSLHASSLHCECTLTEKDGKLTN